MTDNDDLIPLVGAICAPNGAQGHGLVLVPHSDPQATCITCGRLAPGLAMAWFAPEEYFARAAMPRCPECVLSAMDDPGSGDIWYESVAAWQSDQVEPDEEDEP